MLCLCSVKVILVVCEEILLVTQFMCYSKCSAKSSVHIHIAAPPTTTHAADVSHPYTTTHTNQGHSSHTFTQTLVYSPRVPQLRPFDSHICFRVTMTTMSKRGPLPLSESFQVHTSSNIRYPLLAKEDCVSVCV